MTFDDIPAPLGTFSTDELLEAATTMLSLVSSGPCPEIIRQWAELNRRSITVRDDNVNRRLAMLERQAELYARLIGELRNKVNATDDPDDRDKIDYAIEELNQRVRTVERREVATDKTINAIRLQIEATSGNVERLRDEVRKIPRRESTLLADIVDGLALRVDALERSQFATGVISTTTTMHPNHNEEGCTLDMTPRCNDGVMISNAPATHPFNPPTLYGQPLIADNTVEDGDWQFGNSIGSSDADG